MSLRGEAVAISRINLRDCFVASAPRNDADLKLLQLSLHPWVLRGGDSFRSRSVRIQKIVCSYLRKYAWDLVGSLRIFCSSNTACHCEEAKRPKQSRDCFAPFQSLAMTSFLRFLAKNSNARYTKSLRIRGIDCLSCES